MLTIREHSLTTTSRTHRIPGQRRCRLCPAFSCNRLRVLQLLHNLSAEQGFRTQVYIPGGTFFTPLNSCFVRLTVLASDCSCKAQCRPPSLGFPAPSFGQACLGNDLILDPGPLRPPPLQARTISCRLARRPSTSWLP